MSDGAQHEVRAGECVASIAFQAGLFPATVWDHPQNQALKDQRQDPNVLMPGDMLFVPALTLKEESCGTESKHRFQRRGVPAKLNVQLMFNGEPRADLPYTLVIDGVPRQGRTDGQGWVRETISPSAQEGVLTLRPPNAEPEELHLHLGHLDPLETVTGVKGRLRNLGLFAESVDDPEETPEYQAALRAFQKRCGLNETGTLDDQTRSRLEEEHLS